MNLIKMGVEPRLGILNFMGGELLGRQLLQMQIDFVVFYICFEVDSIYPWPCVLYLSHSSLQLHISLSLSGISLLETLDKDIMNTFCMRVRYCKFKISIVFTFFWVLYETTFKIVQSRSILTSFKLRSISHKCLLIL